MTAGGVFRNSRDAQCHSALQAIFALAFVVAVVWRSTTFRVELSDINDTNEADTLDLPDGPYFDVCEFASLAAAGFANMTLLPFVEAKIQGHHWTGAETPWQNAKVRPFSMGPVFRNGTTVTSRADCIRFETNFTYEQHSLFAVDFLLRSGFPTQRFDKKYGYSIGLWVRISGAREPENTFAWEREDIVPLYLNTVKAASNCDQVMAESNAKRAVWRDSMGGRLGAPAADTDYLEMTHYGCDMRFSSLQKKSGANVTAMRNLRMNFRLLRRQLHVLEHVNDLGKDVLNYITSIMAFTALLGYANAFFPVIANQAFQMHIPWLGLGIDPAEKQALLNGADLASTGNKDIV